MPSGCPSNNYASIGARARSNPTRWHEDKLVIEGTLAFEAPAAATPVWQEFYQGPSKFRRSLRLGTAVDSARVEALYRNGQLMITMAKAENAKPRQIQVQGIAIEAKPE